jgi:hypothetical protein
MLRQFEYKTDEVELIMLTKNNLRLWDFFSFIIKRYSFFAKAIDSLVRHHYGFRAKKY